MSRWNGPRWSGYGYSSRSTKPCVLIARGASLAVSTPYNQTFLDAFKDAVPSTERRWGGPDDKVWYVDPKHGAAIATLIEQHFGEQVQVPQVQAAVTETRILEIHYLGATKEREDGKFSAYGLLADGSWTVVFPQDVLTTWFMADMTTGPTVATAQSLPAEFFARLGLKRTATKDEIRAGYRRLARQWHPDVCQEPGAMQIFQAIRDAYEILSDDEKRAKYLAGLTLQSQFEHQQRDRSNLRSWGKAPVTIGYRSPLRCGYIAAEGKESAGKFIVSKIVDWQDIVNAQGQTLVSSWPRGADAHVEMWA